MRDFFLNYANIIIISVLFCYGLLLYYCFKIRSLLSFLLILLILGLFFDAFIILIGKYIYHTILFYPLNKVRFILHGAIVPILLVICGLIIKTKHMNLVYLITFILVILGFISGLIMKLEVVDFANIIRMKACDDNYFIINLIKRLLSFGTVIPIMLFGGYEIFRNKKFYLFLSGFLMFAFSVLGPATGNADLIFLISIIGELLMSWFLYLAIINSKVELK